jgi:ubiquitin-protein ligase
MPSETISPSVKKREKTTSENRERIAGKKKKDNNSRNSSSTRSSQGGTSTSLRRIKKEYKDAVDMGIAYDWVNQRLVQRKTKMNTKQTGRSGSQAIICLGPMTTNLRQWHFSFKGAGEGLYSKGIYHGQIILPKDYPLSPPSVQMWTPSGRFVPHMDICLSASNYHPESWTPRWSIQGIVNALRLHMINSPNEIGGMTSTRDETMEYARLSLKWKKTWVASGSSGTKKTKITIDHRLLIKEGILSDGVVGEETDVTKGDILLSATDDTDIDIDIDSVSDFDQADAVKTKADATTLRDDIATSKDNEDNSRIRPSTRFIFSSEVVGSIFQLAILYMIVFIFLNR